MDKSYALKEEPYNAIDETLINKRADLVKNNEKVFSKNYYCIREIAEEKEQSKSQEDIFLLKKVFTLNLHQTKILLFFHCGMLHLGKTS